MKTKRLVAVLLLITISLSLAACQKDKKNHKEKQLSVYVDVKDKDSQDIIKICTEEFSKQNSAIKIKLNNSLGSKIEEDVSKGSAGDIIISDRENISKLVKKGLLVDLKTFYEKNKIMERYYPVAYNYGRIEDKVYGMPIIPYTIEFMYNTEVLNKNNFKPPSSKRDVEELLKALNKMNIKIPVIINNDVNINSVISTFIINNMVDIRRLEKNYDGGVMAYKETKDMQAALDVIKNLVKGGLVNNNTFELGNNSVIDRFNKGEMPIIITTSYYINEIKNSNIKIIDNYSAICGTNVNVPVFSNCLISLAATSENGEASEEFIKFIFGDEFQRTILNKGIATGNKKVNDKIVGINSTIVKHLVNDNENNITYFQMLPERINRVLNMKLKDIYDGKVAKNEWEEAVEESYK